MRQKLRGEKGLGGKCRKQCMGNCLVLRFLLCILQQADVELFFLNFFGYDYPKFSHFFPQYNTSKRMKNAGKIWVT